METNASTVTTTPAEAAPQINPLERSLELIVQVADINQKVEQQLKRLSKTAKMPGFRPGKVPANLVRQQYGDQANYEAIDILIEQALGEKIKAENFRIAGQAAIEPVVESTNDSPDADKTPNRLLFKATFEVYPEIKLGDLKDVEIDRPVFELSATELESTLNVLRKQRVRYEIVERAAANGDRVSIDFLGKKDGEPFQGGEAKDYQFVLGEAAMLADFEKAVIGLSAGEHKTFEMTFPDDYFSKDLAGQTVSFEITVKEVYAGTLPEIDSEFAKALGVENGDVEKMRAEIEGNLKREVKKRLQSRVKDQVMTALLQINPIAVPKVLVNREIDRLMQEARADMEQRAGLKMKEFPMQREWFLERAQRRVALGLILSEVVTANKLHATADQIKAVIVEAAQSYEHPEEVMNWYYSKPERLSDIEALVVEDNAVAWVLAEAKVNDKAVVFDELMGEKS